MKKTRVHWVLFAVLALMPAAGLARQGEQAKTEQAQKQAEAALPKKEEAQKQTEAAPSKTEEQKQTEAASPKTEEQKQTEEAQPEAEGAPKQTEEAQSNEEAQSKTEDSKLISVPGGKALGMSILGNQEAPKALVIVPWKTSELGNGPSVSTLLDDSRLPIDKEVFMRMLNFYEIRSESAHPSGTPANSNATAPATPAPRRKP
jgi:hypothetical protein